MVWRLVNQICLATNPKTYLTASFQKLYQEYLCQARNLKAIPLHNVPSYPIFFWSQGLVGGEIKRRKTTLMQCFPLYTLLLALRLPTVDFLSLDVEVFLLQMNNIQDLQCNNYSFKGPWAGGVGNNSLDKGVKIFSFDFHYFFCWLSWLILIVMIFFVFFCHE